jgi:enterochelin esterase family protein
MRKLLCLVLVSGLISVSFLASAQEALSFDDIVDFNNYVDSIAGAAPDEGQGMADLLYEQLVAEQKIPLVLEWEVAFLYKGEAQSVEWRGDFTGWNPNPSLQGKRIGQTDLWVMTIVVPRYSRIEYKIVLDGDNWILDPANPNQVMSGYGPNSELQMPEYRATIETVRREEVTPGTLSDKMLISSANLGYDLEYWVYTPTGYQTMNDLPVIYVTDGNDYVMDNMGALPIALDNMIFDEKIKPLIAVLISNRDPEDADNNRRESEFLENPDYARFVAEELVPVIDANYKTDVSTAGRAIMGTSYGGVAATYIAIRYPDVFHNVILMSPSLYAATDTEKLYEEAADLPFNIFIGTGLPGWDVGDLRPVVDFLDMRGVPNQFIETTSGHSWANWRGLLDEMLVYFYGVE